MTIQYNPRVVLFGSGEVTAWALSHLLERSVSVSAVVMSSKTADCAEELQTVAEIAGIKTLAPKDLNDPEFLHTLRFDLQPEIIFSIAYQNYIPQSVLDVPRWGALNWHPSLLPGYRGPDPYFWVLAEGELETGLTVHFMTNEFDAGDIVLQNHIPILSFETWGTLARRLDHLAVHMLDEMVTMVQTDPVNLPRRRQPETGSSFHLRPRTEDFNIDWHRDAQSIVNLVRASNPNFGARTRMRDNILFIFKATVFPSLQVWKNGRSKEYRPLPHNTRPGEIVDRDHIGFYVQTGSQLVRIEIVQQDGDYLLSGADFASIERLRIGERLEEIQPVTSVR